MAQKGFSPNICEIIYGISLYTHTYTHTYTHAYISFNLCLVCEKWIVLCNIGCGKSLLTFLQQNTCTNNRVLNIRIYLILCKFSFFIYAVIKQMFFRWPIIDNNIIFFLLILNVLSCKMYGMLTAFNTWLFHQKKVSTVNFFQKYLIQLCPKSLKNWTEAFFTCAYHIL